MNYGSIIQDTRLVGDGVTTITPTTELLLPTSEVCDAHIFGAGESVQAVTQVLRRQETERGKEILEDGENKHHKFLGPRNCQSGLRCCK